MRTHTVRIDAPADSAQLVQYEAEWIAHAQAAALEQVPFAPSSSEWVEDENPPPGRRVWLGTFHE